MKEIPLSRGFVALVDDDLYEELSKFKWCVSTPECIPYAVTQISMHRMIMGLRSGDRRCVDHKNGNSLDNRRENLRVATTVQNARNKAKERETFSRFKGVSFQKRLAHLPKPWRAQIFVEGRSKCLGYYRTEEEAAQAYNAAAQMHYGEFARVNDLSASG